MNIHIPPAALEAGARALWKGGHVMWRDSKDAARAAFLAMIEAWPDVRFKMNGAMRTFYILPLQQETRDDQ